LSRDGLFPWGRWALFWAIALAGSAFDLAAKAAVFARVPLGTVRPVLEGMLDLQPTHNRGALWGFGSWLPYSGLIFAGLSIVAGVAIVYWLFVRGAARDLWLTIALGLIMAGALGNCYDRLTLGYVRDFVHLRIEPLNFEFAIFNFADNMLVAGAALLMLLAFRPERPSEQPAAAPAEPTAAGEASG
jgi:signal peptidase II